MDSSWESRSPPDFSEGAPPFRRGSFSFFGKLSSRGERLHFGPCLIARLRLAVRRIRGAARDGVVPARRLVVTGARVGDGRKGPLAARVASVDRPGVEARLVVMVARAEGALWVAVGGVTRPLPAGGRRRVEVSPRIGPARLAQAVVVSGWMGPGAVVEAPGLDRTPGVVVGEARLAGVMVGPTRAATDPARRGPALATSGLEMKLVRGVGEASGGAGLDA